MLKLQLWKDEFKIIQKQVLNEVGELDKVDKSYTSASKREVIFSIISLLFQRTGRILEEMRPDVYCEYQMRKWDTETEEIARDFYREIYEFHTKMEIVMAKIGPSAQEKASDWTEISNSSAL